MMNAVAPRGRLKLWVGVAVAVVAFAWLVWPTPWVEWEDRPYRIRRHFFTGKKEILAPWGTWEPYGGRVELPPTEDPAATWPPGAPDGAWVRPDGTVVPVMADGKPGK
jgi:hypothetical protein